MTEIHSTGWKASPPSEGSAVCWALSVVILDLGCDTRRGVLVISGQVAGGGDLGSREDWEAPPAATCSGGLLCPHPLIPMGGPEILSLLFWVDTL